MTKEPICVAIWCSDIQLTVKWQHGHLGNIGYLKFRQTGTSQKKKNVLRRKLGKCIEKKILIYYTLLSTEKVLNWLLKCTYSSPLQPDHPALLTFDRRNMEAAIVDFLLKLPVAHHVDTVVSVL